jgi:hypothetical protein
MLEGLDPEERRERSAYMVHLNLDSPLRYLILTCVQQGRDNTFCKCSANDETAQRSSLGSIVTGWGQRPVVPQDERL